MVGEIDNPGKAAAVVQALSEQPNPKVEAYGITLGEVVSAVKTLGEVHAELLEAGYNVHITPEGRVDLIAPGEVVPNK